MSNLHLVKLVYLGATNTKGARVKLVSSRGFGTITLYKDYEIDYQQQAQAHLEALGHKIVGHAWGGSFGDYFVLDTFHSIK